MVIGGFPVGAMWNRYNADDFEGMQIFAHFRFGLSPPLAGVPAGG